MSTISIIVPIYNVEKYLNNCIDSILAQTYTNFELILVNDGSTDRSRVICDDYVQKDKRIRVVHKKNGGVSSARNAGIDVASGEYVAFVDPDDTVELNMYEVLLQTGLKHNVDIVVCPINTINLHSGKRSISSILGKPDCIIDRQSIEEFLIPSIIVDETYSIISVFNKLYKKSLFMNNKIRFDENKHFGEDARLNFTLIKVISNLVYVEQPLYNYYIHQRESLGQKFRDDLYVYARDNKNFLISLCREYKLDSLINNVRRNFSNVTIGYMQDVAVKDIRKDRKIMILTNILNDKEFIEDLLIYKSTNAFTFLIKYICILKNETLFINFIKLKNRIRPYLKRKNLCEDR
ncbi:glycosyltransferase [Bacillus salipaludis]|uniref:Glycosyltransferase n=1 Tax=Bacillus salipaludis TaxID=2547811 RepID=A0ABW8R917_9BACI